MTDPTHAGSVAFRESEDGALYLVVASSDGAHWVLPKGHIQQGESPEHAALRELREEAGVSGEIVAALITQRFDRRGESVICRYFLVRAFASGAVHERRRLRWETESAALELLSFDDARIVLRQAAAALPGG